MTTAEVYVPTWGRAGNTATLDRLKRQDCVVVVRAEEEEYYKSRGWRVMVLDADHSFGLGQARQFIIENSPNDLIWMVDDDLTLDNLMESIQYISYYADKEDAGIFGMGTYFMSHNRIAKDGAWTRRGAGRQVWGVNRKKYLASKLDMSPWILCQDLYCWVSMQIKGHRCMISNECLLKEGTGAKSGGSVYYRSKSLVTEMITRLHALYPDYIDLFPSDRGTVSGIPIGQAFRVKWAKIHKEIPRV